MWILHFFTSLITFIIISITAALFIQFNMPPAIDDVGGEGHILRTGLGGIDSHDDQVELSGVRVALDADAVPRTLSLNREEFKEPSAPPISHTE